MQVSGCLWCTHLLGAGRIDLPLPKRQGVDERTNGHAHHSSTLPPSDSESHRPWRAAERPWSAAMARSNSSQIASQAAHRSPRRQLLATAGSAPWFDSRRGRDNVPPPF